MNRLAGPKKTVNKSKQLILVSVTLLFVIAAVVAAFYMWDKGVEAKATGIVQVTVEGQKMTEDDIKVECFKRKSGNENAKLISVPVEIEVKNKAIGFVADCEEKADYLYEISVDVNEGGGKKLNLKQQIWDNKGYAHTNSDYEIYLDYTRQNGKWTYDLKLDQKNRKSTKVWGWDQKQKGNVHGREPVILEPNEDAQ
ncbi:MAG: hypothetical protein RSD88_07720 [Anaerovoracaceae bacterium]